MAKLEKIEGIGPSFVAKLAASGVRTTHKLLNVGCTPKGRKQLSERTGISESLILNWVNKADLFRVKGVGEEYSDLLEASGVDTIPELAQRNAKSLYQRMQEVKTGSRRVRRLPNLSSVEDWVVQAQKLQRKIEY